MQQWLLSRYSSSSSSNGGTQQRQQQRVACRDESSSAVPQEAAGIKRMTLCAGEWLTAAT
jgi:hypothetical protein